MDVVALVAAGAADREIARNLGLTINTVRHHLSTAMQRCAVRSRTELVAVCYASGLLETDCWPPAASGRRCIRVMPR